MSPDWYPKPETLPGVLKLVATLAGVDVALAFGERHGGQQKYIPEPDTIDRAHWLAQALGVKAARLFAAHHRGESMVIPSAKTERNAVSVRRLWADGKSINEIVAETHLSRGLVKRLTDGIVKGNGGPPIEDQAPHCPVCGHKHRARKPAAASSSQLCFGFIAQASGVIPSV
ncbi:hypothetical protein D3874_03120 [Oleomonas cavernae]|uniref:Uncharacterized protein n=1 Tax=Oleomonas cavernae TaxID=2320859 RepID=A0A418WU81_9PROT|nr:hypothetical protein [Oleomonas cavernae]RJF94820.1 hypothetical protein D3874_03120 [Oleomonas cavernae]